MRRYVPLFMIFVLLLAACGGGAEGPVAEAPVAQETEPATEEPAAEASPGGRQLDQIIAGAREEGRLFIADSIAQPEFAQVIEEFNREYPFITVEHLSMGGADIVNRVLQEAQGGATSVDLFIGGVAGAGQLADEGLLRSVDWRALGIDEGLILNEWQVRGLGVLTVLGYNTDLVSEDEVPKNWEDLLNPKWKGKVAVPISGWGSMAADLSLVWGEEQTGEYTLKLKDQAAPIAGGPEVGPRVGSGEYPLGIMRIHHARIQKQRGAPIDWVFLDPVPSPMLTWQLPTTGENPNAAQLWVRWVSSPEGHTHYEEAAGRGNPWIPGTKAAEDVKGLTLAAFEGGPEQMDERVRLEDKFTELIRP